MEAKCFVATIFCFMWKSPFRARDSKSLHPLGAGVGGGGVGLTGVGGLPVKRNTSKNQRSPIRRLFYGLLQESNLKIKDNYDNYK